jgi:hypothetical protein
VQYSVECNRINPCGAGISQSVQRLATGRTTKGSEFESRQVKKYLFSAVSRPALELTQPPIQWVSGDLSLGIKRPVREADHSSFY